LGWSPIPDILYKPYPIRSAKYFFVEYFLNNALKPLPGKDLLKDAQKLPGIVGFVCAPLTYNNVLGIL